MLDGGYLPMCSQRSAVMAGSYFGERRDHASKAAKAPPLDAAHVAIAILFHSPHGRAPFGITDRAAVMSRRSPAKSGGSPNPAPATRTAGAALGASGHAVLSLSRASASSISFSVSWTMRASRGSPLRWTDPGQRSGWLSGTAVASAPTKKHPRRRASFMTTWPQEATPAQHLAGLELAMDRFPMVDHPRLLAEAEQRYKGTGNLAALRAVREYRAKHLPTTPPSTTTPR